MAVNNTAVCDLEKWIERALDLSSLTINESRILESLVTSILSPNDASRTMELIDIYSSYQNDGYRAIVQIAEDIVKKYKQT